MNEDPFHSPTGPFLHVVETGVSEITDFAWSLTGRDHGGVVVRFLRGRKMTDFAGLDNEFAAALQFPWYYGENWAAFDECLKDLSWVRGDVYLLVITNAEAVLEQESEEQYSVFIKILEETSQEWSQPQDTTESWGHGPIPFHIILQTGEVQKKYLIERLSSIGASFDENVIPLKAR